MAAAWQKEEPEVQEILQRYPQRRSAIMPLLHLAQERRGGYLAPEDLEAVGEVLGLTVAEVESVASFYALYHRKPVGRYVLTVCANLSCHLSGARELVRHLQQRLGVEPGQTTRDGLFTLEVTPECLAACDQAPAVQVNGYYLHRVTPRRADELVEALRQGRSPQELAQRSQLPPPVGEVHADGAGGL
ncbi:MAG TPA: NAD(P)H-dependent oxidoreductase subunit E [Limnochordales bacterium]